MKDATHCDDRGVMEWFFCALVLASMLIVPPITAVMLAWDWVRGKLGRRA